MNKRKQSYEMTEKELEALTVGLDEEFVIDQTKPLSREGKALWERAKTGGAAGRRSKGNEPDRGVEVVMVVEEGLLSKLDALAKRQKLSRAALITMLLAEGEAERAAATSSAAPTRPRRSARPSRRTGRKVA